MLVHNTSSLESAITEWSALLGDAAVTRAEDGRFSASTTGAKRNIPVVIKPDTYEQVPELLRIASHWGISIYTVSTGHNWGYGSANPVQQDCALLDLSGLDSITDFDEELGVVTVGPGVTQQKLREFLDAKGAAYLVPVTGAGPNCSLLGNALERGYGITPVTDHFAAVTRIEAVLADGRVYRTPLSELGGREVDGLYKWGVGPYLDGLFSQGNFGVVTRMTLALAPAPESLTAFFFSTKDDKLLEELVPTVRQILRSLTGNVVAINLMNRQRMLSMMAPFPESQAVDGVLPAAVVDELAQKYSVTAWNGVGAIYASRDVAMAARRTLRRLLGPVTDRLVFVNARKVALAQNVARMIPSRFGARIRHLADALGGALDIMNGRPNDVALALAYWRSGHKPEPGVAKDPARDGCGLIWFAPLVPIRGKDARRYVEIIERICPEYGINPLITLTTLNDRCFDSTVPLLFDRNDPNATDRANACYRALFAACSKEGFLPYRLNVDAMDLLPGPESVFSNLTQQLKTAVDPGHILSPGRYVAVTPDRSPS